MTRFVGFQMDPIEDVDITADSSFRLAEEAQMRGHHLFTWTPDNLAYNQGDIEAVGRTFHVCRPQKDAANNTHVTFGPWETRLLANMDVVWLRQDPPFDMGYVTTTHLLDMLPPSTLVVNNPTWVRNYPEKLLVLQFPDLTPPTMIARDLDILKTFRQKHGDVIVKPLYGNGGMGVFRLKADDPNFASLHEVFCTMNREPLIIQKFLPDVSAGDKRVILVNGDPVGAINRIPATGETRSNMHVGGRPEPVNLTPRDLEICAKIGPLLRDKGQIFVGIDIIGPYLTEINVTSPTGIQELERFDGINVAAKIWDAVEAQVEAQCP